MNAHFTPVMCLWQIKLFTTSILYVLWNRGFCSKLPRCLMLLSLHKPGVTLNKRLSGMNDKPLRLKNVVWMISSQYKPQYVIKLCWYGQFFKNSFVVQSYPDGGVTLNTHIFLKNGGRGPPNMTTIIENSRRDSFPGLSVN